MAPHAKGIKVVPWYKDHVILDRLDEHMRLRSAGMRRQDIARMQSVSLATYVTDEKHILLMHQSQLAINATNWADTVSIGITRMIARAEETLENPQASEPRKTGALDSLLKGWAELGKLQGAYKSPGAEPPAAPAGPAISVTNVLALVAEKAKEFTANFPGRTLEQQLRHYGSDNIRLPARVEALIDGVAVPVEDGDDED